MEYIIENSLLRAVVSDMGGEILSLQTQKDGGEFIWQGAPGLWDSHAPNLFPICGRVWNCRYTHNGKSYELGLHGFLASSRLKPAGHTAASVTQTLEADAGTLASYPFDFSLNITHSLYGNTLRTRYTVTNLGNEVMPFSVGGHPGFNLPLPGDASSFSDYYIEFADKCSPRQMGISPRGYQTGTFTPYPLKDEKHLSLSHSLFEVEGVFLTGACRELTLKSDNGSRSVHMRFPDMSVLGLWHDSGTEAPYVCIEPWAGSPDTDGIDCDIDHKADMFRLAPGHSIKTGFDIAVS